MNSPQLTLWIWMVTTTAGEQSRPLSKIEISLDWLSTLLFVPYALRYWSTPALLLGWSKIYWNTCSSSKTPLTLLICLWGYKPSWIFFFTSFFLNIVFVVCWRQEHKFWQQTCCLLNLFISSILVLGKSHCVQICNGKINMGNSWK